MTMNDQLRPLRSYAAHAFPVGDDADGKVATITLNRPEKKNPLTFESYAELRDLFRALVYASDVKAVVVTGAGGNFCSGGDVHEIIGPLTKMTMPELLAFTRMTGDLVLAMRHCPQPIVAAIDGVCAGAGAMVALAADLRLGTPAAKTAFLFVRVGLAGCDMGACTLLPRMIGQGRAAELLYTGRAMTRGRGPAMGILQPPGRAGDAAATKRTRWRRALADGPTFAHAMTKKLLHQEWAMDLDAAIEAEAQAQAICMQTRRFPARVRGVRARRDAEVRGQLTSERRWTARISTGRSSMPPHRDARRRARRVVAALPARRATSRRARRRRALPRTGAGARRRRRGCATAFPPLTAARCRRSTRARCASSRETLAYHDGLADFAFAMQGLGQRRDHARGTRRAAARAGCRASRAARRSRRSRCPSPTPAPTSAAMTTRARRDGDALGARRLQDVDLQRRHRRLLLRVRAHRRGDRRARASRRSSCPPTRRVSSSPSAST